MKKNIFKVFTCVFAVTLVLGSTGNVAFAAELGTEGTGTDTENTFTFSVADLCEMFDVETEETTETGETAETVETVETTETVETVEAAKPAETVETVEAAKPAEAVETVETTKPAETAKPVETAKPAETAKPVETAKPAETAKPVVMAAAPARTYARTLSTGYNSTKTNSNTFVFSVKDLMTRFVFSVDDLMNKFINNPKEPEYVTVSHYYCNCGYDTLDYNALKQHMFQHVIRGQRNSYHTVVEKILKQ